MKHVPPTRSPLAAVAAVAFLLTASCGGGTSSSPSTPAAPTPAPTSDPGGGVSASCSLGQGSLSATCDGSAPALLPYVESAIDLLVREKPEIVDLSSELIPNTGQYRVLDQEAYLDTIALNLRRQGLCAERDPDDLGSRKILAKDSNDTSETFDVLTDDGFIRRGNWAYVETCSPASFPVDRTADMPPAGSGCGRPYPPPISRFNVKVHLRAIEYYTLDATPIVGPDSAYCAAIGYTDGRSLCPVRPEGADDRTECEAWRIGSAADTGRVGPTWTNGEGAYCSGPDTRCENAPDNQFQLRVYASDTFEACAENGACGQFLFER
jgi:hypothetical protein